jgi:hypothetical protein
MTPLFNAPKEIFKLLISKGAEKNAKTSQSWSIFPAGSTPLDIAEKAKHYNMAAFLKGCGCKRGEGVK